MPAPARVFLDWSEPTAPAAARWLKAAGRPHGRLVIVPTRQARRRLRAEFSPDAAPAIITPADFLTPADESLADPLEAALALAAELASPRAARCTALFPSGVPARSFSERLALARRIRSLQTELTEAGFTVAEAAARLVPGSGEAARWRDLARLLKGAEDALARAGRRSRDLAWLESTRRAALPPGIEEVVVVGAADLPPIVAAALERLSTPVTVLIPAPPGEDAFDPWGRPLPQAWKDRDPGWRDFGEQVRLVSRPSALADEPLDPEGLEIGLLDRELLPGLAEALATTGRALHDPLGLPLAAHWLGRTLGEFASLEANPAFDRIMDLLRNGAVRAWLAARMENFDADAVLESADAIRIAHFPATLAAAKGWTAPLSPLRQTLAFLEATLTRLDGDPLRTATQLAEEFAEAFRPGLEGDEPAALDAARRALHSIVERLALTSQSTRLSGEDWRRALVDAFSEARLYPARVEPAVDASGWLELPWSAAPHILLAGMNLGKIPVAPESEIFLTAGIRRTLGLAGAEDRFARDAYFLARILARQTRVTALVGQLDAQGSPLQPSPLLFAGAGDTLPDRVERLFADARPPQPDPAWTAGWRFDPPVAELPRSIAVTDFERYLDCPFTFYLRRAAGMQIFEPSVEELDAAQFGDLIHSALENWSLDPDANRSTDAATIVRSLGAHVDAWTGRHLGSTLSLPLRVQLDSARARLAAFADWQAGDFRAGWRIRRVEARFDEILGRPWEIDGWKIAGRVDRLDENEITGRWRVIDYKTFDAPDEPARKHLRAFRSAERAWPPPYARVPESADWWINLQLPLYRELLVASGLPAGSIDCGYFNLPKTVSETGFRAWDSLDDGLQASALHCARGVLADLGRRKFWPPNPLAAHPDFTDFFPLDPVRVVDPEGAFVRSCAP